MKTGSSLAIQPVKKEALRPLSVEPVDLRKERHSLFTDIKTSLKINKAEVSKEQILSSLKK